MIASVSEDVVTARESLVSLSVCQGELVVSEKNMLIKVWKKPFGADSNNAGNSHSNNIWKNIWERTCLNSLEMIHDSRL